MQTRNEDELVCVLVMFEGWNCEVLVFSGFSRRASSER